MAGSSLDDLQRQVEADPASPLFVPYAAALLEAGRPQHAVEVCRAGLEHHPDRADARVLCGRALLRLGQATEARAHFEAALAAHPRDAGIHAAVGEALLERGLHRSAAQLFRRALALDPADLRLQELIARAEGRQAPAATRESGTVPPPEPTVRDPLAAPPPSPRQQASVPPPVREAQPPSPEPTVRAPLGEAPPPEPTVADPLAAPPPPPSKRQQKPPARVEITTFPSRPGGAAPAPAARSVEANAPPPLAARPAAAEAAPPAEEGGPPPIRRDARQQEGSGLDDLLADLPPPPPQQEAAAPQPEPSVVAEEAATAAAIYERELRERLAAEQARPPSWLRRHRLGISLCLVLAVGAGAGWAAWRHRREATHAQDVQRYTAQARNALLRDTLAAYRASIEAIDEVLDREERNPTARAIKAHVLAVLAVRFEDRRASRSQAAALLGPAEAEAEPELVLATRLLLADEEERKAVEDEVLAVPAESAGAMVHSLAGEILLRRNELAAAIARFNAALAAQPGHVPTLVRVAAHYRSRAEYSEALRYDRLALAVVEDHPLALLGAAEAQLALARDEAPLEEALAGLAKVPVEAFPAASRHRAVLVEARLLAGLGRREAAVAELEQLRAPAAADDRLLAQLARAFLAAGAPDRAVELFRVDAMSASTPLHVREAWAESLLALERWRAVTAVPTGAGERSLHLLKGIAWLQLGEREKARAELRKTATRQAGKMPADAVVHLALADLQEGAVAKARRNLERLGTGSRARTTGRQAWAQLLVRDGELVEAERVLREAVALDRDAVEARCALGRLLLRRGDTAGARAALEEAVARNPFHTEARTALGAAALAAGDLEEARRHLALSVARAPGDADTLAWTAVLEARAGNQAEAKRRLGQVAQKDARRPAVLAAKAELALLRRETKTAIGLLQQATKADDADPRLWLRLGEVEMAAGDAAKARASFARALRLDPASIAAFLGEVRALAESGNEKLAAQRLTLRLEELEKAAAAKGADAEAGAAPAVAKDDPAVTLRATFLAALAEVTRSRDHAAARARAEEAVALAPALPAAHLALGRVLADADDRAAAETHLRQAADAGDREALHALGLLLYEAGEPARAAPLLAKWLEQAIEGPAAARIRERLADATGTTHR